MISHSFIFSLQKLEDLCQKQLLASGKDGEMQHEQHLSVGVSKLQDLSDRDFWTLI